MTKEEEMIHRREENDQKKNSDNNEDALKEAAKKIRDKIVDFEAGSSYLRFALLPRLARLASFRFCFFLFIFFDFFRRGSTLTFCATAPFLWQAQVHLRK